MTCWLPKDQFDTSGPPASGRADAQGYGDSELAAEQRGSKCFRQAGILQDTVGRVSGLDLDRHREWSGGARAGPHFVVASALAQELAPALQE